MPRGMTNSTKVWGGTVGLTYAFKNENNLKKIFFSIFFESIKKGDLLILIV